ncbi:hypothetical protein ABTZ03_30785 [Kitasatospora sp. NPDC096077]|uniref:hypothetical protein n=1 Tax=Kitasatospora sp. NPDC096077 TaxID=3155544 RepID=UPI0033195BB9
MPEGQFAVFTAPFADVRHAMGDGQQGDLVGVPLATLHPVRALHFEPAYFYGPDCRDLNPVGGSMRYWLNNKSSGTQRPSRGPIVFVAGPELSLTEEQITVLRAQHHRSLEIARSRAKRKSRKRDSVARQTTLEV